ncbi:HIT family protein [Halanaerobiaceae bacterium Z-7014]|uniref:HIT family protein n=2 Tax=Halonatronomonas betaini TaxID=2778430 RepID=A0A931AWJ9_9FIRM|nr:HIT family protein [Halonatronomonas betaini]
MENEHAIAIYDKYPVNEGHMMVISKRHFSNFFEATDEEILCLFNLLKESRDYLEEKYNPDGFNIGVNIDEAAGQTVMHLHIHLIPRYEGDIDDPRGGVRKLKKELVPFNG